MNDRATRIANLSPKQRRLLELMLLERAQARADESRTDESIPALPRHSERGQPAVFPLTAMQRWQWFQEQRHPDLAAPPVALTLRLRGPLDVAALEASLCEICVRHEVLRTTFDTRDGEPVQIVGPPRPVSLTQLDLSELPSSPAREAEADRLLVQEAQRPFDLSGDLMLRAMLLRLGDEEHVLLLVMHHIVSDLWSRDVLFRELQALYRALRSGRRPANLPELPIQYADYALWEQQRLQDNALQQQMEYWKKQLANTPKVLDVPTDHLRPHSAVEGMWQELRMPASLLQELYALCHRHSVTLFVTLVSAWATLLHRYSGQDDILIFTHFANRNRAEVKGLIGMFANTLVLRHDLSGDPSFAELLGRVRETVIDAVSNGELPFETLIKEWRPTPMAGFFLRQGPGYSLELDGLQVEQSDKNRARIATFLSLRMREGDEGLTAWLNYHPDLFEGPTIARMLGNLQTLLESVVADPEQRISKLPLPIKAGGGQRARFKRWLRRAAERVRGRLRHTVRRTRRAAG